MRETIESSYKRAPLETVGLFLSLSVALGSLVLIASGLNQSWPLLQLPEGTPEGALAPERNLIQAIKIDSSQTIVGVFAFIASGVGTAYFHYARNRALRSTT